MDSAGEQTSLSVWRVRHTLNQDLRFGGINPFMEAHLRVHAEGTAPGHGREALRVDLVHYVYELLEVELAILIRVGGGKESLDRAMQSAEIAEEGASSSISRASTWLAKQWD